MADFYFGARTQYELASLIVATMRQRAYYAYVQDDLRLSSKLTVNVGLRYEYVTPYYEGENRLSNFAPASNTIVPATDGSIAERALVDPDRNNFAPRFGFAYQLLTTNPGVHLCWLRAHGSRLMQAPQPSRNLAS